MAPRIDNRAARAARVARPAREQGLIGSLFDKRFVIVAGKGGVGKSTVAAAIGLAAARRGLRTLIAELNTTEKVPLFFGLPPVGYQLREVAPNLHTINIQPGPALEEYGLMKLKYRTAFRVVFENDFMRKLVRMIPGMNELLLIGKAWYEEDRVDDAGKPFWDMVIIDAPATGHGVSLLRLPSVVLSVVKSGPMADDTRAIRALLTDPRRTAFNVVALPEELPFAETLELLDQNDDVLEIPLGHLFINQVWPSSLGGDALEAVEKAAAEQRSAGAVSADSTPDLGAVADCLQYLESRRRSQEEFLHKFRSLDTVQPVEIPYVFDEPFGADAIDAISNIIDAAAPPAESGPPS